MLETSVSVQRLLHIEDSDPEVLHESVRDGDLPLWPRVRMFFAQSLAAAELGENAVATTANPWSVRRRLVRALLPSRWDARGLRTRRDLLAVVGGGTVRTIDSHEDNWLVGDYLRAAPERAALLQWRALPGAGGAPSFRPSRSLDPLDARVDFRARRHALSSSQVARIDGLLDSYAELFRGVLDPGQLDAVKHSAQRFELLRPLVADEFARILDRVQPRTVLMEDASYGHRGALIAQMKERGIHVAEPQHGWIGPSHAAYNFGAAMFVDDMRAQLPDELLTFGDFWSQGIRVPYRTTAVGKPHLEHAATAAPAPDERARVVLVVSSIADPEGTERFVLELDAALPDEWTVAFRPHPSERAVLDRRYPRIASSRSVTIDAESDVYVSLAAARAVVGTASTVLYEAVPFGTTVFVRESAHTAYYAGTLFGDVIDDADGPEVIARTLTTTSTPTVSKEITALWAPEAATRVRRWVSSVG